MAVTAIRNRRHFAAAVSFHLLLEDRKAMQGVGVASSIISRCLLHFNECRPITRKCLAECILRHTTSNNKVSICISVIVLDQ
jgi:hypothetical protein